MSNVPALRDEPYILNEDDYMQKIVSKTIAYENSSGLRQSIVVNWLQVIRFLMEDEDFGVQIKKEIPRTADLDAQLKIIKDPYQRMNIIYQYVKKNMEWNGSPGIWALDGVKAAWKDKKGTAGEINLILINLLKDAGLNAKPILVSTHDNGLVNSVDAGTAWSPGFYQFNKVLAWVTIGNNIYVLDGTDKETPANLIPLDVVATEGLVIEKIETFEWGWRSMWKDNLQYKNMIVLQAEITPDGKLTGEQILTAMIMPDLVKYLLPGKAKKNLLNNIFRPTILELQLTV